ncbi:hypothetical protein ACQRBF_05795 [Peptoniphilaceae bacterium SGI.131]
MFERIKTYMDFANLLGDMILCNEISSREIDLINGNIDDEVEIFQWYIISDPSFALKHSDELIFYVRDLDLYILGVTQFGINWSNLSAPNLY